jgi:bifunctional N-acetylglucosamine-1-phosphate-uridyltransferase/glucosamine-1-phosphate-acetyltransferase GlmU-like protein
MSRVLVVPAAGAGSRLRTSIPKVLVPVAGRTMLDRLLALYAPWIDGLVVVAHPSFSDELRSHMRGQSAPADVVEQRERTGMLDAVLLAAPVIARRRPDEVWITWADQVGVLAATVQRLAATMAGEDHPAAAVPTVQRRDPYVHFDRDASGRLCGLRQRREGDAMPAVGESDMGLFALTRDAFERQLPDYARGVVPGASTGERNFVPFVPWLAGRATVATFPCTDAREAIGINTPEELRFMEEWIATRHA